MYQSSSCRFASSHARGLSLYVLSIAIQDGFLFPVSSHVPSSLTRADIAAAESECLDIAAHPRSNEHSPVDHINRHCIHQSPRPLRGSRPLGKLRSEGSGVPSERCTKICSRRAISVFLHGSSFKSRTCCWRCSVGEKMSVVWSVGRRRPLCCPRKRRRWL